jgi:hypothetical protein
MKSVLLGSAAGILATAAAQAADLPVMKAAAVQYVKVCSAYGTGFFEIPGTDTCIKIWAHKLGIDVFTTPAKTSYIISQDSKTAVYAATYWPAGGEDVMGMQITARPGVDIRRPTGYGTFRAVIVSEMKNKYGMSAGTPPGGSGATAISCYRCYMEWAGFTLGTTSSAFPYLNEDDIYGSMIDAKNSNVVAQYSFKAAGGLSGSIGFEDPLKHFGKGSYSTNQAGLAPSVNSPGGVAVNNGPYRWWDVVGALNWEQDWGNIAVRGALHQISLIATGGSALFTPACPAGPLVCVAEKPTLTSSGFALLAGVTFKLPSLGSKDQIVFQFIYGDGALDYVGFSQTAITGAQGDTQSWVGGLMRDDHDAIAISNGDGTFRIEKEKAWSGTAQYRHYWAPDLRSNIMVNYAEVTPGAVTQNTDWSLGGLGKANRTGIGANIIWGTSKTSELSLEAMYVQSRQTLAGTNGAAPSALPAGISANNDNWHFHFAWESKW